MNNQVWGSEAIHVTESTCVDVKANASGVVLGQVGDAWFHDLHLTPEQAQDIAVALIHGASASIAAR